MKLLQEFVEKSEKWTFFISICGSKQKWKRYQKLHIEKKSEGHQRDWGCGQDKISSKVVFNL